MEIVAGSINRKKIAVAVITYFKPFQSHDDLVNKNKVTKVAHSIRKA